MCTKLSYNRFFFCIGDRISDVHFTLKIKFTWNFELFKKLFARHELSVYDFVPCQIYRKYTVLKRCACGSFCLFSIIVPPIFLLTVRFTFLFFVLNTYLNLTSFRRKRSSESARHRRGTHHHSLCQKQVFSRPLDSYF